jgi:hypothetical protein
MSSMAGIVKDAARLGLTLFCHPRLKRRPHSKSPATLSPIPAAGPHKFAYDELSITSSRPGKTTTNTTNLTPTMLTGRASRTVIVESIASSRRRV